MTTSKKINSIKNFVGAILPKKKKVKKFYPDHLNVVDGDSNSVYQLPGCLYLLRSIDKLALLSIDIQGCITYT